MRIFAAAEGIDYSSLTIVTMPFAQMHAALANGEVDAASVPDPFATQIERAGEGTIVDRGTLSKKMPAGDRVMITGLVAKRRWIEDHRDLAARIAEVVGQVIADRPPVAGVGESVNARVHEPTFDVRLHPEDLQLAFDLAADFGVVSGRLAAEDLIAIP